MQYYLKTIFSKRQSFYNKAVVEDYEGIKKLFSHNILVAKVNKDKACVFNVKIKTTLSHVKEFLLQNNFKAINKKQIIEDYGVDNIPF